MRCAELRASEVFHCMIHLIFRSTSTLEMLNRLAGNIYLIKAMPPSTKTSWTHHKMKTFPKVAGIYRETTAAKPSLLDHSIGLAISSTTN
jgi:hypothetical protein